MTPLWLHAALLRSAGADVQRAAVAVLREKISAGLRLRLFFGAGKIVCNRAAGARGCRIYAILQAIFRQVDACARHTDAKKNSATVVFISDSMSQAE